MGAGTTNNIFAYKFNPQKQKQTPNNIKGRLLVYLEPKSLGLGGRVVDGVGVTR